MELFKNADVTVTAQPYGARLACNRDLTVVSWFPRAFGKSRSVSQDYSNLL